MSQLFKERANSIARATLIGVPLLGLSHRRGPLRLCALEFLDAGGGAASINRCRSVTSITSRGLGIDCRYCHTGVEQSAFAGLPPTETCMTCHSQVWKDAPVFQPVRDSWQTGAPIKWTRVHDLPDYVYFDHSIHVAKGVGCATCHGQVNEMPLTWKTQELYMSWCLDCHRAPEKYLRPTNQRGRHDLSAAGDQLALGRQLLADNNVHTAGLTDCYTCHR